MSSGIVQFRCSARPSSVSQSQDLFWSWFLLPPAVCPRWPSPTARWSSFLQQLEGNMACNKKRVKWNSSVSVKFFHTKLSDVWNYVDFNLLNSQSGLNSNNKCEWERVQWSVKLPGFTVLSSGSSLCCMDLLYNVYNVYNYYHITKSRLIRSVNKTRLPDTV